MPFLPNMLFDTSRRKDVPTLKVLLVEDCPAHVALVRSLLNREGPGLFALDSVFLLDDAIRHLQQASADVVLLDLGLQDSEGLRSVERLHGAHPTVPIIVLTGASEDGVGLSAVQTGAEDYICKTELTGLTLIRTVRYVVERCRRHQKQKAREMQEHFRPPAPRQDNLDVVGSAAFGDFYDFVELSDDQLMIVVGDAGGDSGPLLASARAYVRASASAQLQDTLKKVNGLLQHEVGEQHSVALSVACLDLHRGEVSYAAAGQPPAYIISRSGERRELSTPNKNPLGVQDQDHFEVVTQPIQPEDLLVLATQGLEKPELLEGLARERKLSAREILHRISEEIHDPPSLVVARISK